VTGLPLAIRIQPADTQDRDGALAVIQEAVDKFPALRRIWAEAGCQGQCEVAVRAATGCELEMESNLLWLGGLRGSLRLNEIGADEPAA
jgi:short-subunit dehydrogenase involved in D-alanine esterification of teichoic acids